ncbi:MAG: calcineurin-like phosphoesterase family protein [Fimbriimonadaceae bacterium]|nr:calcineurin-like phosphoesterase family protein [Fimbriimonadaceae bacterium]
MYRREFLRNSAVAFAGLSAANLTKAVHLDLGSLLEQDGVRYAEGYVFHDRAGLGVRRIGDVGIANVSVSNGTDVVRTDRNGKYRLPVTDDCVIFVIKPSGWQFPLDHFKKPKSYYVHKPEGSPSYEYAGVRPTGNLPQSIDFGMSPEREPDKFRMVMFGDPQPRNQTEIDYIAHDVVEQCARDAAAMDCKFGMSLGDIMFDDLSLYESLHAVIGTIDLPWYSVVGNHDLNFESPDTYQATETWHRVSGPTHYAFNYGRVHFIVLNDVMWSGGENRGYRGELTPEQLEFVKNDLAFVPKGNLLVVCMHIPLVNVTNREALYRLIEDRPHTLSFSAHTHVAAHTFIGEADGWKGATPHHHVNHVTVCGSWWEGAPDERGIPHATMSDGGPNGYSIVEFDRTNYKITLRPASRPVDEQMNIWIPEEIPASEVEGTVVTVNVFAGSERSVTELRVNGGEWHRMENFAGQCPYFVALKAAEQSETPPAGLKLPNPSTTRHLWRGNLPAMRQGTHTVEVRTKDMFGQEYTDRRILRVV